MISMWHQEEQTASGAVLLEIAAESLTLHFRTDRCHMSQCEEAPQSPYFTLFSWSLSRTVGYELSLSVGRAAPRWPLGDRVFQMGLVCRLSVQQNPKECKASQMDDCIAIGIRFLLLPSQWSHRAVSLCVICFHSDLLYQADQAHTNFLSWAGFLLLMCYAECPTPLAKPRSYVNHRKWKKYVVQPQNQFPRQKIKNRDVAEWDAKVSLHLGRDYWVN